MNFQTLLKVEKPEFYLGKAFRESIKVSSLKRSSKLKGVKLERSRTVELKKIEITSKILISDMSHIVTSFPSIDELDLFYQEMINAVIGSKELKTSLSSITWIKSKIKELNRIYQIQIKKAESITLINQIRREYYGRISSVLERRKKDFIFLEESRKKMRGFPAIKTHIPTICIVGYPNVGKSTLLTNLTPARPEINIYPFTTKGLMLGYIGKKLQIIDTPGTFGESLKKMNYIEQQAFLALKYLSKKIIFVFDLSESCGYTIQEQEKLFKIMQKHFSGKKFLIFFSKKDLLKEEILQKYKKKYNQFNSYSDPQILRVLIMKNR
ncbi:MAG: GTPase [archaeon]